MARRPANNVLLTGARGTGKSSLIKACLNGFAGQGLRLIEVDKADLADLPDIVDLVASRPERFVIFCDDLSFEEGEAGYKALKVALDGSIATQSDNVLIYATSNRRHLMPEKMADNTGYKHGDDGELHPGEAVEEKISLSERFGLWLSFYPFRQDDYLEIVAHWLQSFGCTPRADRGGARRGAAMGAGARLAFGTRGLAVRQGFRRQARHAAGSPIKSYSVRLFSASFLYRPSPHCPCFKHQPGVQYRIFRTDPPCRKYQPGRSMWRSAS